ncbi:MAG: tetratricopeptide repeat protein [Chlorobia bacterium]|nr:tetratricopeptide repeat protein [Fimbriimonadaceae bacterium]
MDSLASPLELKQRADDLYAKQDYAAAAEDYRSLVQGQPGNTAIMKQLGLALTLGGQLDEGLKTLQTASAMQPADPEIRYAYGYALGTAGRFDEAIEELDASLNLSPNHIPARQGLIFCLLTSGQAIAEVNPHLGEIRLDRATKLDPRNPHVAMAFLEFMVKNGQKGKAVNFIKDLDSQVKELSPLKEAVQKLESNPDYAIHLKQAAVTKQATAPAVNPKGPGGALKQVPCPACKQLIMDYAAICPHCNTKLKATGTFSTHDTGPAVEWQEVAYTIMSIIIVGLSALGIFLSLPDAQKGNFKDVGSVPFIAACFQMLIGLGLLFRQEWIGFLAKIFLFLRIAISLPFFAVYFFAGRWLVAGEHLLQIAVAGFMIYLINYVIGD